MAFTTYSTAMDVDTVGTNQSLSTMMDIDPPTTTTTIAAAAAGHQANKYRFDYGRPTTTTNDDDDIDLGVFRRNIRHVDTTLRSLAKEPFPVRRAAAKDLYNRYSHLADTVAALRRQGVVGCAANDTKNVAVYIRHVTKLRSLIVGVGSDKDFSKGLARLEKVRLPEPRVIRIDRRVSLLRGLFAGVSI